MIEDLQWVMDAKNGDLESYNRLVIKYQQLAYNIAYRISGNTHLAEDAVQNGFISGYQNINSFKDGSFKNWILRIISNACYDLLRNQNRQRVADFNSDGENDFSADLPEWISEDGESPEDFTVRQDLGNAIQQCLKSLDENFRTLVILIDMQDMNYVEASTIVGKPVGTIKSRLSRARKKMQSCLQNFSELLPDKFRYKEELTL